jgi:hypothetical protein
MSEFKAELRRDMADLKGSLRNEMADLKLELRNDMADLKLELRNDMAGLRTDMWKCHSRSCLLQRRWWRFCRSFWPKLGARDSCAAVAWRRRLRFGVPDPAAGTRGFSPKRGC